MQAELVLSGLSKTFNKELLFKQLNATFPVHSATAITGHNGSGKSTLLKIIAGLQLPTEGKVAMTINAQSVPTEKYYQYLSYAAPYVELMEEYTLQEMLVFYFKLKPLLPSLLLEQLPDLLLLPKAKHKEIRSFSSGMKQRLKLGLAFFSNTPLVLLDEPTSHLDEQGKQWYKKNLQTLIGKRTLIIASNQEEEIECCTQRILISDYC
ncbi:MAG TPA: ATP-binding cassette domain-containing protein [Cytophagaceae bacterium]|jgi:ABC-type multidrug transport system ATPase subunit|nr:ATP-binding cassette domain-containing protein [Cytophagaceae bacterium]